MEEVGIPGEVERSVQHSLGTLAKDKKGTWVKSCKESMKRDTEVLVMADELNAMGKNDEHTRAIRTWRLKRLRKIKEKEAEKELLEEVQDRKQQLEDEVWTEMEKYIVSWDPERRISSTLNAKIWQLVQGSTTKTESLENEFTEIAAKVQEVGLDRRQEIIQVLGGTGRGPNLVMYLRVMNLCEVVQAVLRLPLCLRVRFLVVRIETKLDKCE